MVNSSIDGRFYAIGMASFGISCEISSSYSVFTYLNKNIVDWIRANMN